MTEPSAYRFRARNIEPDSPNKIHDDEVAQRFGFSGALVPGKDLFAYVSSPLVGAWGEAFLASGRLETRFRKPVYDGEDVVATAEPGGDGTWDVALVGPDGVRRTTGRAWAPAHQAAPDLSRYADTPPHTGPLRPPVADSLPLGPMPSVVLPYDEQAALGYLEAIGEPVALYRDERLLHPGLAPDLANRLLFHSVDVNPWIHTASDVRFHAAARFPATLTARGVVTDRWERGGNSWVRYDALLLADGVPFAEVDHWAIYALGTS